MSSSSCSSRLLSLSFLPLLLISTTSSSPPPSASSLCRHSDTPSLCLRISSHLPTITPLTLTQASINTSIKVALRAKSKALFLSLSPHLTPHQKSIFQTCAQSYADLLDDLRDSAHSLAVSSPMKADVMNYLSAASFVVTVCDDSFRQVMWPEEHFPLARVNKTLRKYVSNALAMGDQLLALRW